MSELQDDGAGGNGQDEAATTFASPAKSLRRSPAPEPTSVLYHRSPSPPTSSSLASSSAPEPPPISAEDWEAVLSGGDMAAPPAAARSHDTSFLRWIMDADAQVDAAFDPFLPPPPCQQETAAVEHFLHPQPQLPLPVAEEDLEPGAAVDELLEAARHADAGDSTGAREILARLNHRLPSPPGHPHHPPLLRAAAHLRDALLRLLVTPAPGSSVSTPLDVALKVAAHRALADASPTVQFASFTSTQALLDALGAARRVHVVDLDVGFGGQWAPLMQELALQWRGAPVSPLPPPCLKVTALVSLSPGSSAHPLELLLTQEGLTRFAAELGISFEFSAVAFDPSDPLPPTALTVAPGEAVAVHLPVGSGTPLPPTALRVVKQLRPAVVVCVDHGCHRGDLPLPHHALNVVRSSAAFLESLDAAGAPADAVARLEQYVLRPRVERLLLGDDRMPPWQTMLEAAGFAPVQPSDAAEAQAECLVRRTPTPEFHVEKRQAALALRWKESELVTVSAWRCSR